MQREPPVVTAGNMESEDSTVGTFCTLLPNLVFSLSILANYFYLAIGLPPFQHPGAQMTSQTGTH